MGITRIILAVGLLAMAQMAVRAEDKTALTVVVMDPLALELSCPCVKGYAQRDYNLLGKHLEKQLGRPVRVHFSESLATALAKKTNGKADLIFGKESIVRHEAKAIDMKASPIASLTGKDGKTTMTGLFLVAAKDDALAVNDLKGYQIFFGPADSDEKHTAALALLGDFEVARPKNLETCNSCSDGATKILDLHRDGKKAAAVISSYAQPLLEGCGTIKKGELRVVGETDPVPFVVAFISQTVPESDTAAIQKALLQIAGDPKLCLALETKHGFVKFEQLKKK